LLIVIAIDQSLKYCFLRFWPNLVVRNKGVAFGILPGDFWIFTSLLLIIGILYLIFKNLFSQRFKLFGLIMIASGGIANLIDRITKGVVIDFIKIPLWPTTFNVADLAITYGVILFLWNLKLFTKTSK
jgi:signal peptidase II